MDSFWMVDENINEVNWPKFCEIDIMKVVNREAKLYTNNHLDENEHEQYGNMSLQFDITQLNIYEI